MGRMSQARLAQVLSTSRETRGDAQVLEAKVDEGGGDNSLCEVATPPGIDAVPLPQDTAVTVRVPGEGRAVVVSCLDTRNEGEAEPGEIRIYSRDADGGVKAVVHIRADGSLLIDAPEGVTINGDCTVTGELSVTGDITAEGEVFGSEVNAGPLPLQIKLGAHGHPTAGTGPVSGPIPLP